MNSRFIVAFISLSLAAAASAQHVQARWFGRSHAKHSCHGKKEGGCPHKEGRHGHPPIGHGVPPMGHFGLGAPAMEGDLHGMVFMKADMLESSAGDIGLTKDQRKAIGKLVSEARKTVIRQRAEIEAISVDIHAALHEEQADKAALHKLIDKKHAIKAELAKSGADALLELKGLITEEQRAKLKEMREKHAAPGGHQCPHGAHPQSTPNPQHAPHH